MKPHPNAPRTAEIELKLALPTADLAGLAQRLSQSSVLSQCTPTHQHLHNVYFDSPAQNLRAARVALRLRRVQDGVKPKWLQTLKMGGRSDSALSQRGEWESPVARPLLSRTALQATPWSEFDPDGSLFRSLKPCFVTQFQRTLWWVRLSDGSEVEVALDIGHIESGAQKAPIVELELELLTGQPTALFEVAQKIAHTVAVLPATSSKAARGYALAQGGLNQPVRAQPVLPLLGASMPELARRVLREMFGQFTSNLNALLISDAPEVLHQARIGWRRFTGAIRLFKTVFAAGSVPPWDAVQPLLAFMGPLRDLDVAQFDTLPLLEDAYVAGDPGREKAWRTTLQGLACAASVQRKAIRYALQIPELGANLLRITQWLEGLAPRTEPDLLSDMPQAALRRWAKQRVTRMHQQFEIALKDTSTPEGRHHARILAKRLRYAIEALRPLLPKQRAARWYEQALDAQSRMGTTRDWMQASTLVAQLALDNGPAEFLRGMNAAKFHVK